MFSIITDNYTEIMRVWIGLLIIVHLKLVSAALHDAVRKHERVAAITKGIFGVEIAKASYLQYGLRGIVILTFYVYPLIYAMLHVQ